MLEKPDQALTSQSKLGSGQEPRNKQRRAIIGGGLAALAVSPLLVSPRPVMAQQIDTPSDPFIVQLKGVYQAVPKGTGPNLGLQSVGVHLSDGSYSVTKIYPIFGITNEEGALDQNQAIGNFFVQFMPMPIDGNLCAYQLPGGAIAMQFNSAPEDAPPGYNAFNPVSDGAGGFFLDATFELEILDANGIYEPFGPDSTHPGGHNHMVDRLHKVALANGQFEFDEFCFCNISTYKFP